MGKRKGRRTKSDRAYDRERRGNEPIEVARVRGPRWWRRLQEWLERPVGQPPAPNAVCELTRYAFRIDAESAVRTLEINGVWAVMYAADAEGAAPHLGAAQGNRVMVRFKDYERAAELLRAHAQ